MFVLVFYRIAFIKKKIVTHFFRFSFVTFLLFFSNAFFAFQKIINYSECARKKTKKTILDPYLKATRNLHHEEDYIQCVGSRCFTNMEIDENVEQLHAKPKTRQGKFFIHGEYVANGVM